MFPTRNFERLVINALLIIFAYFHYSYSNLKIGLEAPTDSGKLAIFFLRWGVSVNYNFDFFLSQILEIC